MKAFSIAALGALFAFSFSNTAGAYCQTHTCEFSNTRRCEIDPLTGCTSGGVVAHWDTSCITYAVQSDGSSRSRISAGAVSEIVDDGFGIWSDVVCPSGTSPELTATFRGETPCDEVEYNCEAGAGNNNIVMFRDGASELSSTTIALSTIMAKLSTGEILDVDIEINSRDFDFYVSDAEATSDAHDLRLVLNHELGHFLGLSHTRVAGALMRAAYDGNDRFPGADDAAGICRAVPAGDDPSCSVPPLVDGGACVGADSSCAPAVEQGEAAEAAGCSYLPPLAHRAETPGAWTASARAGWLLGLGFGLAMFLRSRASARGQRRAKMPHG
jgi:hypothetical protein